MTTQTSSAYAVVIVGIVVAELAAVVVLRINHVEIDQGLYAQLAGIGTSTLVAALAFVRGVGNSQEIRAAKEETASKLDRHHRIVESQLAVNTERTEEAARAAVSATDTLRRIEGNGS